MNDPDAMPNVRTYGWGRFKGTPYMDDGKTPRCAGYVNRETGLRAIGGDTQCAKPGKYLETDRSDDRGYWWCGTHAPSKVGARYTKTEELRLAAREAQRRDARIRDAAYVMLEALEAVVHDRPSAHSDAVWGQVNAAIAKARGE